MHILIYLKYDIAIKYSLMIITILTYIHNKIEISNVLQCICIK